MLEKAKDIHGITDLIHQTETLIDELERLTPASSETAWLPWRLKTMRRRLDEARKLATKLADEVQVAIINQHVSKRLVWGGMVLGLGLLENL